MANLRRRTAGPNDGDPRAQRVIAQAQAMKQVGDPLVKAFLEGLRAGEQICRDQVAARYEAADRSTGDIRAAGNQRAAAATECADRIQDVVIAAAESCARQAPRGGLWAKLAKMVGADA